MIREIQQFSALERIISVVYFSRGSLGDWGLEPAHTDWISISVPSLSKKIIIMHLFYSIIIGHS